MNSTYGIVKPSLIDPEKDVEIWYHYRPSRSSEDVDFKYFKRYNDVASIFRPAEIDESDRNPVTQERNLLGMYNLNLPINVFGRKGIYTIYIKPREYYCTIKDIGSLSAYPDTSGIVMDLNDNNDGLSFSDDSLVGYRIEYFNNVNGTLKREEFYRIITSNNKCEPVSQNLSSGYTKSNGYRFNGSGTLCFMTVTPSTAPSFKGNSLPYIGAPNQRISITNTKFDPVVIEVEMVEHDIETLSIMAEGEVVRNLENGRVTHYNFDGEIYKQYEYFTVKDNYTKNNVAEVKTDQSTNVDSSLPIEELKNS